MRGSIADIFERVDTHVTPPLKRKGKTDVNEIYDRYGKKMAFYSDVPAILAELKESPDVQVAIASRTHAPRAQVGFEETQRRLNLSMLQCRTSPRSAVDSQRDFFHGIAGADQSD